MSNTYLSTHYTKASCILDDRMTGKRYRACGGGYDRLGTVVANWLEVNYQDRLEAIADHAHTRIENSGEVMGLRDLIRNGDPDALYGLTYWAFDETDRAHIEGACGIRSVLAIAEAIGLTLTETSNDKGRTGYLVEDVTAGFSVSRYEYFLERLTFGTGAVPDAANWAAHLA